MTETKDTHYYFTIYPEKPISERDKDLFLSNLCDFCDNSLKEDLNLSYTIRTFVDPDGKANDFLFERALEAMKRYSKKRVGEEVD